jgi:tRNA (cmo5U34)-methyltransferase
MTGPSAKMTVDQIRDRFDREVERFSNLQTGQVALIDAPLMLELLTRSAAAVTPGARDLLDIGCGAGNYSLKMLEARPGLNVTLVDLSQPMLDRAVARVSPVTAGQVTAVQSDMRSLDAGEGRFDIIIAAATLHHLRTDAEWEAMFAKCYRALRPGGGFWIADFICHSIDAVQDVLWARYGDYLTQAKGESYRDDVFRYIALEDTPKPLLFQVDLLRAVGFSAVEILHKTSCFAAFGAVKSDAE